MRISDWSSDVCASDLRRVKRPKGFINCIEVLHKPDFCLPLDIEKQTIGADRFPLWAGPEGRSEEHTSELQSLMRTSYAVFCLKKKRTQRHISTHTYMTHQMHCSQQHDLYHTRA